MSLDKKRKRSLGNSSKESLDPHTNKTIKCGVCGQVTSEREWDQHVQEDHCLIAWKLRESFNIDDPVLFEKLKDKLKSQKLLKCKLCNVEKTNVKTFLEHSKKCLSKMKLLDTLQENKRSTTTLTLIEKSKQCAVCKINVKASQWLDHIGKEHNYLAWCSEEPVLNLENEMEVRAHLMKIAKQRGGLNCGHCDLHCQKANLFLNHVKACRASQLSINKNGLPMNNCSTVEVEIEGTVNESSVICGVCKVDVNPKDWGKHISDHDYIAWKEGETPINRDDEMQIKEHLYKLSKRYNGLTCSKCGTTRKYVKSYLGHVKSCEGSTKTTGEDGTDGADETDGMEGIEGEVVCGVCCKRVEVIDWYQHIPLHNYLAWPNTQTPLDVNDNDAVYRRLYVLMCKLGKLMCIKCGVERRYVKSFLEHISTCKASFDVEFNYDANVKKRDIFECAVCHKKVLPQDWENHSIEEHYNVAWIVGEIPIDINNPQIVLKYLKEYKRHKSFVCKRCGMSRSSAMGFYAHVITCGKTEEESEVYKMTCEVCNNKILCINKSAHMRFHRDQEEARERKKLKAAEKASMPDDDVIKPHAGRRAAVKALGVIKKYKSGNSEFAHQCPVCRFGTDDERELEDHDCNRNENMSDSERSGSENFNHLENQSKDESDESNVDSNVSDEEMVVVQKKRRGKESSLGSKIERIPFKVNNFNSYLKQSVEDFERLHIASETLFENWRTCEYEMVPDDQISNYLPQLEVSCKVKFLNSDWITYKRFEVSDKYGLSLFTGGCIQRVAWAPVEMRGAEGEGESEGEGTQGYVLAVATHGTADTPRYAQHDTPAHSAAIQLWDFADFITEPRLSLCLSHDYGTVWDMCWCPSGACDRTRLGLLAVACSNGIAYIFSVPHPSTMKMNDHLYFKLKPVAQLRMSAGERKNYQATAICWSTQKGHGLIVVGYSDGSTAFYDLYTESPLLRSEEDSVTVLYPYHDERPIASSITGVDVFPRAASEAYAGAYCAASPIGVVFSARSAADVTLARVHSHTCAGRAAFMPHWPAVVVSGDDALMNQSVNEVEWWGMGRRLGAVSAWCACARCGVTALYTPPLLRAAALHPAATNQQRQILGMLQMTPLNKKRKINVLKDELTSILEPTTYEDAISRYGVEFGVVTPDKGAEDLILSKTTGWSSNHERFPLADVTSMAFCLSSGRHHNTLAVATHSGLLFVIDVKV